MNSRVDSAIVTVDVEPDKVWENHSSVSFQNLAGLTRFHELCAAYGVRPTYLVTQSIAEHPDSCRIMESLLATGICEIGAHSHCWEVPPFHELDSLPSHGTLYPRDVLAAKLGHLTSTLRSRFGDIASHRSGRWGFDRNQAEMLISLGYAVDSSVTPGIDWRPSGGPDFSAQGNDCFVIEFAGDGPTKGLLEVPCTIRPGMWLPSMGGTKMERVNRLLARAVARIGLGPRWLRAAPTVRSTALIARCKWALRMGYHVNLMTHSSELFPGTSPYWPTERDISDHFGLIEAVFAWWQTRRLNSCTLAEFAAGRLK